MFIVTLWIIHWSTLALLLDNRKVYRHSNTKRELRTHCRYLKAVRRYWEGRYFVILYAAITCRMTVCQMTVCWTIVCPMTICQTTVCPMTVWDTTVWGMTLLWTTVWQNDCLANGVWWMTIECPNFAEIFWNELCSLYFRSRSSNGFTPLCFH